MPQHLVVAGLLDIQDLALQRQYRLELAVAPLLGRAAGRLSLNQIELAAIRLPFRAVGQLARQSAAIHRAFTPRQVACLACRLPRPLRIDRLVDDLLRDLRIAVEKCAQALIHKRLHRARDV